MGMARIRRLPAALTLAAPALALLAPARSPLVAQEAATKPPPAHIHIRHAAESFRGTPDGMGLLPTAIAEAEVAVRHALLAAADPTDLDAMKRHAGHVLHALDPTALEAGPGLGYGMTRAAERAAHWVELAMAADGGGDALATHGPHVATAARAAAGAGEEAAALAKQIMEAESADAAAALLDRLTQLTERMAQGTDADGDGRVSWQETEGGLAQARQHLDLLLRGEGLTG